MGENVQLIGQRLANDCSRLSHWMMTNKFKLNADKTHFMVVGSEARLTRVPAFQIYMDGVMLTEASGKKETLLGIIIQKNLKWSSQVDALTSKLKNLIASWKKSDTL